MTAPARPAAGRRRHAPVIEAYWYSLDWDVERIWALDLPVEAMAVARLAWHMDVPVWPHGGRDYAVTPAQVLADAAAHPDQHARVLRADLAYPIDITRHRGRWLILDGIHRLARATMLGIARVSVRKVPPAALSLPPAPAGGAAGRPGAGRGP